jgi:predicted CXXCH cytochrome family protein
VWGKPAADSPGRGIHLSAEKEDGTMADAMKLFGWLGLRLPGRAERGAGGGCREGREHPALRSGLLAGSAPERTAFWLPLLIAVLLLAAPGRLTAQAECLSCHGDASFQDGNGKSIAVDGGKFAKSIHGGMKCNDCHADIKEYPHPEHLKPVDCAKCHADQASQLTGSVHADSKEHPCTSCHGVAHEIVPKSDPKSAVYPLNIPRTCGNCHGKDGMAQKHGLDSVYPNYVDSIHGYALSKEGLLVAANCQSCHGSHKILSRKNPESPTFKANIPNTCGNCHAKITADYFQGVHGKALLTGKTNVPVCSDCHTAHAILQPTADAFRSQSTPICGSCHKDKFSTYRDTFHSQLGSLGGYVQTARCWDCHEAHEVRPTADPLSPVNPANLITTCGKCHAGANASFVKYQPHANAGNRELNPALYFIRLFMNLLLVGTLTFFVIHTILWLIRARYDQIKKKAAQGGKHA